MYICDCLTNKFYFLLTIVRTTEKENKRYKNSFAAFFCNSKKAFDPINYE